MKKVLKMLCLIFTISTIILWMIYIYNKSSIIYSLAITLMTTAYHFDMRLIVGNLVDYIMNNQADYTKKRYQVNDLERRFYNFIQIKKWKEYMPTYSPERFDLKKYSLEEVIQTMCQSEIVHSYIALLSYVPLFFIIFFDTAIVFITTSILASLFDLSFVCMQRYNRDRILKIMSKRRNNINK